MKRRKWIKSFLVIAFLLCGIFATTRKSSAAARTWQTVYTNELEKNDFVYYVKYGELSIARTYEKVYVKKNGTCKTKALKVPEWEYGGLLTNGRDIMYQNRKNVYLWSNANKVKKIMSFSRKNDFLVAKYKNLVLFARYADYDSYRIYSYNLKTKKIVKLDFYNAYSSYGKYLLINGNFHEGAPTSLEFYNIETKKITKISSRASYANAGFIQGNTIYYSDYYDVSNQFSALRESSDTNVFFWKVYSYNIKTKKKKKIYKPIVLLKPMWFDKNHFATNQYDSKNIDMYDLRTGKKVRYKS